MKKPIGKLKNDLRIGLKQLANFTQHNLLCENGIDFLSPTLGMFNIEVII